ncbi:MAG: hypothetical protein JW739_02145 [Opitutales bacterium]|nr:hypothetical protein [Opitutales bacterium]
MGYFRISLTLFLLHIPWIIALLLSEVLCIAIALMRVGKLPATHTDLAKTYGLSLFIGLAAIIAFSVTATWPVLTFCDIGLLADIGIIAI